MRGTSVKHRDDRFIILQGATATMDDEGVIVGHTPRGAVVVNDRHIMAFYDNVVIIEGHKIRVMETAEEILDRLRRG